MNINNEIRQKAIIPHREDKERVFEALEALRDTNGNPSAIIKDVCFNSLLNFCYIGQQSGHLNGYTPDLCDIKALWNFADEIDQE